MEKDFEEKLKGEKSRFEQKLAIFRQVHRIDSPSSCRQDDPGMVPYIDADSSVEYAKVQVYLTKANQRNEALERQISDLKSQILNKEKQLEASQKETEEKEQE